MEPSTMCGRYSLTSPAGEVGVMFDVNTRANIPERYNVAPTQPVLVVRHDSEGERELAAVEWGLMPEWYKELKRDKPLINARIETITEKPSFRGPIKRSRCLVPANGWIEWLRKDGAKQPYLMERADQELFAMAGIWTTWHGPSGDNWLETMCLLTAPAIGPLSAVHHRRPLIIKPEDFDKWLTLTDPLPRKFLENFDFEVETAFTMREISKRVNNARFDDKSCHDPPEEERQTSLF